MLPRSLVEVLHPNRLVAFRLGSKLIKALLIALYRLWVLWYELVHTKVLHKVVIEEVNNLKIKIEEIIVSPECIWLASTRRIKLLKSVSTMTTLQIKD